MKIIKKLLFAWNEDKEIEFLEKMAIDGYKLVKVQLGKYTFEETEPRKIVYQLDFVNLHRRNEDDYLQMYEDSGWNLSHKFGGWYYFSRDFDDGIDRSIFNNNETKKEKYKKLILFLILTGFPLYYQVLFMFPNMDPNKLTFPNFYFFFRIIVIVFTSLHLYALVRIAIVYNRLNSGINE